MEFDERDPRSSLVLCTGLIPEVGEDFWKAPEELAAALSEPE